MQESLPPLHVRGVARRSEEEKGRLAGFGSLVPIRPSKAVTFHGAIGSGLLTEYATRAGKDTDTITTTLETSACE
jgi:hypothetical protein